MKFLDAVRKELRPDDLALYDVDKFIEKINSLLRKNKVNAKCVRGGSTAKGTFLKDDHDIDLFVIFEHAHKGDDISKILFNAIKILKPEVIHGSRDYFQIKHESNNDLTFEIVPVLEVKDTALIENVTDMSPHHVKWVNDRLNDKLRDDIRLTKKFCKAIKCYGAESFINGFSGHVVDILIINYGGFLNLLKAATKWKSKLIIDIEKHLKDPLKDLDKSKTLGPLIIVDPVQSERNASAAVSDEKFDLFIKSAKLFLKNPSKEFFIEKEYDLDKIRKKAKDKSIVVLKVTALTGKKDVIGTKILKTYEAILKQIELNDFTIISSDWKWDKKLDAQMYFIIKELKLSKTIIRLGPPLKNIKDCKEFKKVNKKNYSENGRLYAEVLRKFRTPKDFINDLIKKDFIKDKVKKIELLQ